MPFRKWLIILFVLVAQFISYAQTDTFTIKEIIITGTTSTKPYVIFKELDFKINDKINIQRIEEQFHKNEKRLYDTGLFNIVNFSYEIQNDGYINIYIDLNDNWFIFPAPIFELQTENFTTWRKVHNYSSKWINYGIRLTHINLTGNRDQLKAVVQTGYTNKYELEYRFPNLNKGNLGLSFNAYYTTNKSAGYKTEYNKVVYWHTIDTTLLKRFRVDASLSYRPSVFLFHELKLQYHNNKIDHHIANNLNSDYFLNAKNQLQYLLLSYNLKYDRRVFKLYPEAGYLTYINIKKDGIGLYNQINLLNIKIGFEQYYKGHLGLIYQFGIEAKTEVNRNKLPYSNYSSLGYWNDFVRGFESYVIDGIDYFLFRSSIRKHLYTFRKDFKKWMPLQPYKNLNAKLYFRFNYEMAYVNDPFYKETNTLNNQLLYGFGPAVDLILYNNYLFSIEYNINQFGEKNIILQNIITFYK